MENSRKIGDSEFRTTASKSRY